MLRDVIDSLFCPNKLVNFHSLLLLFSVTSNPRLSAFYSIHSTDALYNDTMCKIVLEYKTVKK